MKKKNYKLVTAIIALIFLTKPALAWSGYDYQAKTEININSGNLVREGLIIEFYDTKLDEYHNGQILMMEETSSGSTTLRIKDFNLNNKERVFVMMDD